jgi:hypothetical protein
MKFHITLVLLLCSSRALAYDSEAVCLAQCMVNEADTEAIIDHLAIAAILDKRAEKLNISMCQMVHRYCGGLRPRDRKSPRHRWILGLNAHGRQPKQWPKSNGSWARYVDRWFQVLIVADLFLQGDAYDPCGGRAAHWGGDMDVPDRALVRIDCGHTLNHFYAVRSRRLTSPAQ